MDNNQALEKLGDLLDEGVITQGEFDKKKTMLTEETTPLQSDGTDNQCDNSK